MVSSISYGWVEIEQCQLDNDCKTLGIDSATYIERTNVEFQKLNNGMSILVSSGDDGAQSFYGSSGNCPLDNNRYCSLGGCAHNHTVCSSITITTSNGTTCYYPGGSASDGCNILENFDINDAIRKFVSDNSDCNMALEVDGGENYHVYSSCECNKLKTLTNTDLGVKITVTSVGSTQILKSSNGILPPSYSYHSSNRAYPDITPVGHNYQIAQTNDELSNNCPCSIGSVDGTSCSSPTTAGMISLINDKLLNSGSTQLGFLNPLLYQAASQQPNTFNDITVGDNKCNRAYCCFYGYEATKGWDAASGLGSINFENFEQYVLSQKL